MTMTTERKITVDEAESVLRREYWNDVNGICDDVRRAIADGEATDADEAREYAEQSVDGHQRVIYTAQNFDTLRWCSNHDAATDEFGGDGILDDKNGPVNWSMLAYCALLTDVMDTLGDLDELFESHDADADADADADDDDADA